MLALVAALQVAMPGVDTTPPRPITQLVHTRWTLKEGAPREIRALAQTNDGYLWVGTIEGLFRFDGVRFVPFVPRDGDSLPATSIRNLLGARDGSLWITWALGQVSRLKDGRLTSYGERDGLPKVFVITESRTGILVAGTASGIARFDGVKWTNVNREWGYPGSESKAVWFDRDDVLWAQTEDRVVYLPSGARQFLDPGMPLVYGSAVTQYGQEKDGTVWFAEMFRSVHTLGRVGERHAMTEVAVGSWTMLIDRRGSLWIGSAGDGVRRVLDPAKIRGRRVAQFGPEAEQFTAKDGLLSDVVDVMFEDREGNIWVGTDRGLERFREGAVAPFGLPGGNRSRLVFAGRDTTVWVSGYNMRDVVQVGSRSADTITFDFLCCRSLARDPSGVLWTHDVHRILRAEGARFVEVPVRSAKELRITDLAVDPAGTVWVFDEGEGLLRLTPGGLVPVAPVTEPEFPHGILYADRSGRIWIGVHNWTAVWDSGQLKRNRGTWGQIHTFFEDRRGTIWAVGNGGIMRFEGDSFYRLPPRLDVPGHTVLGMAEDEAGAVWLVTSTNILRLPPGEIDRALADSTATLRYRSLDQLDGLPGNIQPNVNGPLITQTADGRIWIATDSGVGRVDPWYLPTVAPARALIETVRVDGRDLYPSAGLEIPPRSRDIEIDYTATGLAMPERVRFRYRLEGEDEAWHEVGDRRRAYFTGLSPGTYRFVVAAHNGDGIWNETAATVDFRILAAWYQTLWFKAGVVLLIGGIGAALALLVQRGRHRRAQQVLTSRHEATLAERARIAQDLHDTLLQGFAGVSMQLKAAERALPEEPDVAAETLLHVQRLTRETLREARERVLDLQEPELAQEDVAGALKNSADSLVAATSITCAVTTRGERRRLPRSLEVAAIRIGREAIANAVRHAGASRIDVIVGFEPAALRLEIRDDGRGFSSEDGDRARKEGHLGLTGMRDRASRAGGSCVVRSGNGGGTVVVVDLPFAAGSEG